MGEHSYFCSVFFASAPVLGLCSFVTVIKKKDSSSLASLSIYLYPYLSLYTAVERGGIILR